MRAPIRVMHLSPALKPDGPGRGMLALMRYLPREDVRSEACSLSVADPTMESSLREHGIPHRNLGMRGYWDFGVVYRLARALKIGRVDLLHTNLSRADWVGRLAARVAGTPVVVSSIRNLHREMYRAEYGRLVEAVASRLDRWTGRWADGVIALSEDVRQRLLAEGYARDRIVLIPNSVDLDGFDTLRHDAEAKTRLLNLPATAAVVGTVAVFKEQKGYPFLIRAAARIRRRRKDVYFLVVGSGPKAPDIHAEIAAQGLQSAFRCVGHQGDVRPYLAAMDLFVLPSLWEGMPRALMEAMAAGVPAIGTNVSGIRDLIENDVTGILVPPGDAGSLADAVETLLGDPRKAGGVAEAARRRVRERHSAAAAAHSHAALYAVLLGQKDEALSHSR